MRNPKKNFRAVACVWLLAAAMIGGLGIPTSTTAAAASETYQFDIKPQPLVSALLEFSKQADRQVVGATELLREMQTPGVSGDLSVSDALGKLLQGTGLQFELVGAHSIRIVASDNLQAREVLPANAKESADVMRLVQSESTTSSGGSTQQETGKNDQKSAQAAEHSIQEIVVTAQKREERLQDVPMSLSAISGADLDRRDINDAVDLSFVVPGLGAFPVSPGKNLLQIRGISGFRGSGPLIGLYMDEIPLSGGIRFGDGTGLDTQTIDLARVEVLKGPQGTLFGEGAMGGVIRYVTNDPKLDAVEGRVTTSFFNTKDGGDSAGAVGVLNLPLVNDKLGVRIAGTYQHNGGWIDNVGTGRKDFNDSNLKDIRAKVLFAPTSQFKVSALVDIHRLDFDGQNTVNVSPYDRSEFRQAVYPDYSTSGYNDFNLYNLTASYDFSFATLLSSTSHFDLQSDTFWQTQIIPGEGVEPLGGWEFLATGSTGEQVVTSQELRLTSNSGGPFKWLIGGNYKHTKNEDFKDDPTDIGFSLRIPGSPPALLLPPGDYGEGVSKVTTVFTDVSYMFFGRLDVGGGLRYFEEKLDNSSFNAAGVSTFDGEGTFDKMTYRIFARYRFNDNVSLYANTATGFRSGGFNGGVAAAAGAPPEFDPETSIFYEAGVKAVFLDGGLGLDLAVFKGKYDDQVQTALFTNPDTNLIMVYNTNIGVAEIEGVEWQLSTFPMRGLRLTFSGDVLDTKFTRVSSLAPAMVGDPLDFVPEYNLVLAADYAFDWAPNVPGFVDVSFSRKGKQKNLNRGTNVGPAVHENDPLEFLQASIGAQFNGFQFSLFGRNLLDERGILNPQFTGMTPQSRPRSFGLSIGKSF